MSSRAPRLPRADGKLLNRSLPRENLSKRCSMLVRWNSPPNLTSCLLIFQDRLSINWLLVSTRCRGSPEVAPNCEKNPAPPVAFGARIMMGRPLESQVPNDAGTLQNPMLLGLKLLSCGKKPSAKRFQPYRNSFTLVGESTLTKEMETSCTRVGVTVSYPRNPPPAALRARGNCQ